MISVHSLSKVYKVLEGREGLRGAVRNLFSRDYRLINAVQDVTFAIPEGEMVGFIGPNGAGKSTTIKILTGILVPSAGQALVAGIEPYRLRQENARRISVVFGQRTKLWWDLPCMESFELHRLMYQIPQTVYERNMHEFTALLGLDEFWKQPVRQLSLGQRMRAELAVSLLHNPAVVYLDEPTIGMDAVAKERMRRFLQEMNRNRKVTMLITSHDMADIEKLCRRVLIIDKGRLVYDGELAQIREAYARSRTVIVEFGREYQEIKLPFGALVRDDGLKKHIRFERQEGTAIDLITTLGRLYEVKDISIVEAEIEAIIREIYERGVASSRR